jgi:hypothetical protein
VRHFTLDLQPIPSKEDVKRAWEAIIINHLQPNNCLEKKIQIEVKTIMTVDFAKTIQTFF